jgi:AcrR family transcriptional regulator
MVIAGKCAGEQALAGEVRRRRDPRREATRGALIEAAETLFAESGVQAVSTRRIGAEIGSANTNVVAYHFGGKDELVEAVYHHRLPEIDRRRGELHAAALADGKGDDLVALIRAFALPLFEQTDTKGRHSYARCLAGLERAGLIATRSRVDAEYSETKRLLQSIGELLPAGAAAQFHQRIRLATALIIASLQIIDQEAAGRPAEAQRLFNEALAMAAAAVAATPTAQVMTGNQT